MKKGILGLLFVIGFLLVSIGTATAIEYRDGYSYTDYGDYYVAQKSNTADLILPKTLECDSGTILSINYDFIDNKISPWFVIPEQYTFGDCFNKNDYGRDAIEIWDDITGWNWDEEAWVFDNEDYTMTDNQKHFSYNTGMIKFSMDTEFTDNIVYPLGVVFKSWVVEDNEPIVNGGNSIASLTSIKSWNFELIQEDSDIYTTIEVIDENTIELTINKKHTLEGGYKWDMAIPSLCGGEIYKYMEEDAQGGFDNSFEEDLVCGLLINEGLNDTWGEETNGYGYTLFSGGGRGQLPEHFRVIIPSGIESFKLYTGSGTEVVIASSTDGGVGGDNAIQQRIFYDRDTGIKHVFFIDNSSDVAMMSSATGATWENLTTVFTGTINNDDFSCEIDYDTGDVNYIHCVYTDGTSNDWINYTRINISSASPVLNTEQYVYDASLLGESGLDDIANPYIKQDPTNDCLVIAFDREDDSVVNAADEHNVTIMVENSTTGCGDGVWGLDASATATGFPLDVGVNDGYGDTVSVGVVPYNDSDFMVYWVDSDSPSTVKLLAVYYNSTSGTVGTERTIDSDIEWDWIDYGSFDAVRIGDNITIFGMDDVTTDLDAFLIAGKDSALTSQTDTGGNMFRANGYSQLVSCVVDVNATDADDIICVYVDNTDPQDIFQVWRFNLGYSNFIS
jgi:hypothetical protein